MQWLSSRDVENQTNHRARLSQSHIEKFKFISGQPGWKKEVAKLFLEGSGLEPTEDKLAALATRLDAAFTLETVLAQLSLLGTYRFDQNPSDWFDCLQLYYLARDEYCFVTQDKRLIKRIQASAQSERVFTFDSYVTSVKKTTLHLAQTF